MARFVPNPDGIRQLEQQIGAKVNQALARVEQTHAGKPLAQVEPAVRRALESAGVTPNSEGVREIAQRISAATA